MKKILTLLYTTVLLCLQAQAQWVAPVAGLSDQREPVYAFTHAVIHVNAHTVLNDATIVIRKKRIEAVGNNLPVPAGAVVTNLNGRHVYPSFIDAYTDYGQPDAKKERSFNRGPQADTKVRGAYSWNQALKPEYDAASNFVIDPRRADELRKQGFGTVLSLEDDGIARGTAAVVSLIDENEHEAIVLPKAAACYSFNKGTSTQDYPSSLMGAIALLRQSYCDAAWYQTAKQKDFDISLEAWNKNQSLPQFFEVESVRSAMRAQRIADEFHVRYVLKGSGDEYQRLEEIKKTNVQLILPVNFPAAMEITNPYDALDVSLGELKHWELAPANSGMLAKEGVLFSITTYGLKETRDFLKNVQKAVKYGLSKEDALRALTEIPAQQLHIDDKAGSLAAGKMANFFIADKDVFEKGSVIQENWVQGRKYTVTQSDTLDLRGTYSLTFDRGDNWNLKISGEKNRPEVKVKKDTVTSSVSYSLQGGQYMLQFEAGKSKGSYRLNGVLTASVPLTFSGDALTPDGTWQKWTAVRTAAADTVKKKELTDSVPPLGQLWYPNKAFGTPELPAPHAVLIRHATIWTNEAEGVLKDADILFDGERILQVGKHIDVSAMRFTKLEEIDGTNLHVTAGIIDEHSHIAIEGDVNEGTQHVTSEVRIGDVIDPDDINIYRQLAGGVTTSHLLHGSANPIGGQTALVKLRWGHSAEQMKFEGADGFIKFALGENVKQANWGDAFNIRYPQSRMGVEQVYMDAFTRAREYDNRWKQFAKLKGKSDAPRRNLEEEALAEILNKKRFITCHSYQQAEINMLMHVADTFGFRVNTFTHILEGYKVADKMKKHGAGASSFADWWAYKMEVIEAIPYNGAILNKVGVVTGFNSDDAEMARRLNQEAAKAVKYGNVSEEEALKFVTLNPAKLLHIDNRVGSLKAGKDADIVLWNGSPLSDASHPLKTFVDGVCYFDIKTDQQRQQQNDAERARILKAMEAARAGGESAVKPSMQQLFLQHCNDHETLPK